MTVQLPTPGGDNGIWGNMLNDFLQVAHNGDGTLQSSALHGAGGVTSVNGKTTTNGAVTLVAGDIGAATSSSIGQANGIATLDSNGYVPTSQLQNSITTALTDKGGQSFNVKAYGAKGDGSADDTAAINACITASTTGADIFFPPGAYLISSPIIMRSNRRYIGGGHSLAGSVTIRQKNGANMTAVGGAYTGLMVANAWYTNATSCDGPICIENLAFDGNSSNNGSSTATAIVLCNFWALVIRCCVTNTPSHGIVLTDTTQNGTNVITNSASENRIILNEIVTIGGDGIRQICANNISNQDGFCEDNNISTVNGSGINFDRGSGWLFRRNHLYGIQQNGLSLNNCFATIVVENEIEDFSGAGTVGGYCGGIYVTQLNGRGTMICDNFIGCNEPSANVGAYTYIGVTSGYGETDAQVIVTDNHISGPSSPTSKGLGLVYQNGNGGAVLNMRSDNNRIVYVNTPGYVATGVKIYANDSYQVEHAIVGATTSTYNGPAGGTGVSLTGSDLAGTVSCGTGGAVGTGIIIGINFEQSFAATPNIVVTANNAATATLGLYVQTSQSGFGIGVTSPPAVSQAAGTYEWSYVVVG